MVIIFWSEELEIDGRSREMICIDIGQPTRSSDASEAYKAVTAHS